MEDARLTVAVWRPSDQWQTDDEAVELQLLKYRAQGRYPLLGVGVLLMIVLLDAVMGSVHVVAALCVLGALAQLSVIVMRHVQVGRWLPAARRLLAGGQGRRVAARVVGHRRGVATLAAGDQCLRVRRLDWGLRQVVARNGEITLLGPDADGDAVVFVDGHPAPLPARVVPAPETAEAEPIARVSWRGAEDEVPNWQATRQARIRWVVVGVLVLVTAAFVYDAQQPTAVTGRPGVGGTATYNWFYAALVAFITLSTLFAALAQQRLPKLLAAGAWQGHPATVLTWKGEARRSTAVLTLRLSLPGGESLPVTVKLAAAELVANIKATGTVWLIGTPTAGRSTAVGVPGHPIVTTARFV